MLKNYSAIFLLLFLCSCASLHTPSPHFVPVLVKKKQFEAEVAAGFRSLSANVACSPLNNLSLMANVQGLPFNTPASRFQRNCELAIGTYGSTKHLVFGLNGGYGLGAYNWDFHQFNDTVAYTLRTRGNFQKLMLQAFAGLTNDPLNPSWIAGISLKENFYWDQYASLKYTTREMEDLAGMERNMTFEPCLFARLFFDHKINITAQAGMNISYDHSMFWPGQYLFLRIGIGIKLGA